MSDTRCFHCGARIVAFQQTIAELAAVKRELHERDEQYRHVIERLSSELDALRQFVEQHSRGNSLHMDGTKNYRMGGYIGRARTLWDAINRSENKTEMGHE